MKKNRICFVALLLFLGVASVCVWSKTPDDFSSSERRPLKQFPEVSFERILSGDFMSEFEAYLTDQFPLREKLRSVKSFYVTKVLGQKDVHDIYVVDGFASKMEYPLNASSVEHAAERFSYVYDRYMKDKNISAYYAVIPDKNYYLAEANGYLSMNYEELFAIVRKYMQNFQGEILLTDLLSIEDYYKTDIHWRQEKLLDVSERILGAMNDENEVSLYEKRTLDVPFYGVYAGQSGLNLEPEMIFYYTNEMTENCVVYDYETRKNGKIYDMEKAYGKDPYEMFLSGAKSLLTIENPNAASEKELILFRDSFGSSVAPLLVSAYKKITLVDIRYIHPDLLGNYIQFEDQDVLFLYSTSVLNNGDTIK